MAENEYIERGAVVAMLRAITIRITPIEENRNMFYHDSGWNGASVAAKVEIGKIPAADVVEVVRCKDCKHASFLYSCGGYMCKKGCGATKSENDFCSYGERKE